MKTLVRFAFASSYELDSYGLMIGITLFGIGLLGEYVGRIYQEVRHRPRYLVEAILEQGEHAFTTESLSGEQSLLDEGKRERLPITPFAKHTL